MSLKTALYSYLSTTSAITALVSTRIYPDMAPEGAALPYIVYSFVAGNHERHMGAACDFASRLVQFDVYGATAVSVEAVFQVLSDALEAKRGTIGSENLVVLSSGIESERDDYISPADGSQKPKHRRSIDINIWHRI
jgi:hypothetical protein